MKLLIVESPSKAKTIAKYLDGAYEVRASIGHVRDLPKSDIGIDLEGGTFLPHYVVPAKARPIVTELKKLAKTANKVYFATDEDREGEAIGRHVARTLGLDIDTTPRITFHEITKPALEHAVAHPRTLDMDLINANDAHIKKETEEILKSVRFE